MLMMGRTEVPYVLASWRSRTPVRTVSPRMLLKHNLVTILSTGLLLQIPRGSLSPPGGGGGGGGAPPSVTGAPRSSAGGALGSMGGGGDDGDGWSAFRVAALTARLVEETSGKR